MSYLNDFIQKEKELEFVEVQNYPNGIKIINKRKAKHNVLHLFYKPLSDYQIDDLQNEVNQAQLASYGFPEWYRDFFKATNGCNVYYGALSLLGEQIPMIIHPEYGQIRALIERDNPNWMAPYNLRSPRTTMFDLGAKKRWLNIGSYHCDGTQVAYDFKTNKVVAMYAFPVTMPIKELKQKKEADFEKLIIAKWEDFETFFKTETERLSEVFAEYSDNKEEGFMLWKKTLPVGHKDFIG